MRNNLGPKTLPTSSRSYTGAAKILKPSSPAPSIGLRKAGDLFTGALLGQTIGQTTGAWLHPGRSGGMGIVPFVPGRPGRVPNLPGFTAEQSAKIRSMTDNIGRGTRKVPRNNPAIPKHYVGPFYR